MEKSLEQAKKDYERFKLQWMLDHGFTLVDLIECLEVMIHEDSTVPGVRTSLQSLFEDWEFGVGFCGGAVWPYFEEFISNDYS